MDWAQVPFGVFAIAGSVLIAFFALVGHWITQRNENIRHARKLAYEAAMTEWKTESDFILNSQGLQGLETPEAILQLDDYILSHLALVDELQNVNVATASAKELAPVIKRGKTRDITILKLRRELQGMRDEG